MKTILALLAFALISTSAMAAIAPSQNPTDFGIASGALNSKVFRVKAGGTDYAIIGVDLVEPACNSTQAVIWVSDENLEGDAGGLAYNLGIQVSEVISAKAQGSAVAITVRRNSVEDCSTSTKETYLIQYKGGAAPLKMKKAH